MLKNKLTVSAVILGVVLVSLVALTFTGTEKELTNLPEKVTLPEVILPEAPPEIGTPVEPPQTWRGSVEKTLTALTSFTEIISKTVVEKARKQNVIDDRQTLMGILINNNFAAIRDGREEDIVFLNGDWTIDKIPERLTLTDKDREFLEKFIKAEND